MSKAILSGGLNKLQEKHTTAVCNGFLVYQKLILDAMAGKLKEKVVVSRKTKDGWIKTVVSIPISAEQRLKAAGHYEKGFLDKAIPDRKALPGQSNNEELDAVGKAFTEAIKEIGRLFASTSPENRGQVIEVKPETKKIKEG